MTKEKIGFIGLGLMGHAMAANLVDKGWPLAVLAHRKREALDDLVKRGATEVATPRALAGRWPGLARCWRRSPDGSSRPGRSALVTR